MKHCLLLLLLSFFFQGVFAQSFSPSGMDKIYYGVAYYLEYMPDDNIERDIELMKTCGINVVRIAESTWATWEPSEGVFDFTKLDRMLNAFQKAGINVIVGTPTYAIPQWMAKKYPEVMLTTFRESVQYGGRQNMDITNPVFLKFAERIIRKVVEHVKDNPAVIGYQADNETKSYQTASIYAKAQFIEYLKKKFITPDSLNKTWNLFYWSQNIANWDDFNVTGYQANQAFLLEWNRFQKQLATNYLNWQYAIINEYKHPNQFVTQNFDGYWKNAGTYGPNPDVDHYSAAKSLDIAAIDLYHSMQDKLDGQTIFWGGDYARSFKKTNYLVMETNAQTKGWDLGMYPPYDGQLRLCFYSHLSAGANMVAYWPWHSIRNGGETFWKGILSHDLQPNRIFYEVQRTSKEVNAIGSHLVNLKKKNKVAILYSGDSFSGLMIKPFSDKTIYADIVLQMYQALYRQNIECDFVIPGRDTLSQYKMLVVPALFVASDSTLNQIKNFVYNGGHVLMTFRSGFFDENFNAAPISMPHYLTEACGFSYQEFSNIQSVPLKQNPFKLAPAENVATQYAELIMPRQAKVLAYYDHPFFGNYAAITQNLYGKGSITYIGTCVTDALLEALTLRVIEKAGLVSDNQKLHYPIVLKTGINQFGKTIRYFFNYSAMPVKVTYDFAKGNNLLTQASIQKGAQFTLKAWDVAIVEEE